MMNNAEQATEPSPASARAALGEAVAKHRDVTLAVAKLTAAVQSARHAAFDARRSVEAAQAAVEAAGTFDAGAVVAAILADAPPTTAASSRKAREALVEAQEHADQAAALEKVLNEKVEEAKSSLHFASLRVRSAALDTVRVHSAKALAAYIAETKRLQHTLAARIFGLQFLSTLDFDESVSFYKIGGWFDMRAADWPVLEHGIPADVSDRWSGMIDRLCVDPKAPALLS